MPAKRKKTNQVDEQEKNQIGKYKYSLKVKEAQLLNDKSITSVIKYETCARSDERAAAKIISPSTISRLFVVIIGSKSELLTETKRLGSYFIISIPSSAKYQNVLRHFVSSLHHASAVTVGEYSSVQ